MIGKAWDLRGFFYFQGSDFLMHSGFPNKASFMGTRQRLTIDDFLEITLDVSLQKFAVAGQTANGQPYKINTLLFQFSAEGAPANLTFKTSEYVELQGLVVFILNEDRSTPEDPHNKPYFVTYRYFPKRVRLMRDYFSLLIEGLGGLTRQHPTRTLPVARDALPSAFPNRFRKRQASDPVLRRAFVG